MRCRYKSILKKVKRAKLAFTEGRKLEGITLLSSLEKELEEAIEKSSQTDSRIPQLLTWAYRTYREEVGVPLAENYARDGKILKSILRSLTPLAEDSNLTEEELFRILWDLFVNRYTKRRAEGFPYFKTQLQKLYEWWKSEREAPIDFGESVATNPKFGVSKEFNTNIELTESED